MSKFEQIIKDESYVEFKEYCESNDFIIEETIDDNSYVFSLTKSEQDNNILINGIVTESSVTLYITNDNGDVIDKIEENYDNETELLSYLKGALVTSNLLSGENSLIDDEDEKNNTLVEEDYEKDEKGYSSIPGGLEDIKDRLTVIADDLKNLSSLSDNLDITSIIMDLANSTYSFALEIEDSLNSYNEIMEVPEEDEDENEELEVLDEE